jgi:TolA-binding protein
MDRAIEKSSLAIQRHSLFFNKKEYNRWIDDCYLLIGKAQFYKQDYNSAKRTFEYLTRQYPDDAIADHAALWIIKCNLQQKRYDEVLTGLELMVERIDKEKVPFSVRKQIPLIYADYYIMNGNYANAKTHLLEGITLNADRKFRMRLYYILGQISQQEKNYSKATEYYTKVSKGPSSFEMAFNARINMAKAFDIYSGEKSNLEKQLKKMVKDSKNKDYLDQVYYALAELAHLDKNDTLEMQYLRLSVSNSVSNDFQKTTSSLQLAELCFTKKKYEDARAYYDTTLQVLPIDYPDYEAINTRTTTLTELVTNLQVVQFEDSMQMLARMPEAELTALITKLVDEYNKKEQARMEEERQQQMDIAMSMGNQNQRNERSITDLGGGGWYFNNPSAISMGYTEFMRKWGRRKLEDNWRLMNKRAVATFSSDETEGGEQGAGGDSLATDAKGGVASIKDIDPKDPKSYMQLIPKSEEALALSNERISDALLNLGYIYKDGLHDNLNSVNCFEDLLERFPDTKYALNIYYQLYLMGISIPDEALASKYKAKIMSGYPNSDYAMIIENPDYNNEVLAKKNRVNSLYEETYQAFTRGQYRMVLLYSGEAIANYKDKELLPKFEYLKALSLAKLENNDTMLVVMNQIVKDYPSSSVTPLAQEILTKFGKGTPTASTALNQDTLSAPKAGVAAGFTPGDTVVPSIYKVNPNQTHFYIMMLNEQSSNVSATKIRISDFILKNFNNDNLSVNAILLDAGWQMITISSFRNAQAAMNFYSTIMLNEYVMLPLKGAEYKHFVISMENYPIFYREKKYDGYINFFNKNYPR